jgi:hypothetical protein
VEIGTGRNVAHESANPMSARRKSSRKVAAGEPGGAGD